MRIVIDLQGAQSTANGNRGIGRYSIALAKAMARNRGTHEIVIALSDLFPDTVEPIRKEFEGLLPRDSIRVWTMPGPVARLQEDNDWRRRAAELARETFLASLRPDIVLVSSLFEGLVDDAVTSVGTIPGTPPVAVILFDLIPFIHRKPYLENPAVERWYLEKIEHLRRADLLLSISEASRQEGLTHLQLREDRCVSISTDADPQFGRIDVPLAREQALRTRYALDRPFVMYTGGIDHRKNIEGLISAFAKLPADVRERHQLAIVCSVQPSEKDRLEAFARAAGLPEGGLVLTGFVPEEDLIALYNVCALFIFPSWHEGFGLPALEAMRCGAPVIGSNLSSIPEVIGLEEALFDPRSEQAMMAALERGLTDADYRARLVAHGEAQAGRFSWDVSAERAIAAMEKLVAAPAASRAATTASTRPRLAFVSPLPPERSGIADYSAELLRALSRHYEIDVIVDQKAISDRWITRNCAVRTPDWLLANAGRYDRVLYHFGNSTFHQHMFDLLGQIPGVVVLHDFFLSGIAAHMDIHQIAPDFWARELYRAHGYGAWAARFTTPDIADVIWAYPCSLSVLRGSLGMIAHSQNAIRLARQWYDDDGKSWAVIPLLRDSTNPIHKRAARKMLGFRASDVVVCTFGMIGPSKQSLRLLKIWQESSLADDPDCHLVFVGENHPGSYGAELSEISRGGPAGERIHVTGWVDAPTYQRWLAAADIAVQLRTLSRGETSAAVLDCMNYGLPTVVNANGSMADLDDEAVWKLADDFADEELAEALEQLRQDKTRRENLGSAARQVIVKEHDLKTCAAQYHVAIEDFYRRERTGWRGLLPVIADVPNLPDGEGDLMSLAVGLSRSFPSRPRTKQILVDVSSLAEHDAGTEIQCVARNLLMQWLHHPPHGYRIEPVFATSTSQYRYARRFTAGFLGCPSDSLDDEALDFGPGDIFIGLDLGFPYVDQQRNFYNELRRFGVRVVFVVYDLLPIHLVQYFGQETYDSFSRWLFVVTENDGAICISRA
ncbi:MAG: glycosyltransferase, partial [Novosphingobium sp.]